MTAPAAAAAVGAQALAETSQAFYELLAALAANTASLAGSMWDGLDPSDLARSWLQLELPDRLMVATGVAQQAASRAAERYVADAVRAQGARGAASSLAPDSLVGVASDGRDLDDLLASGLIRALEQLGKGATGEQAKDVGRSSLTTIVKTQVADTGRAATSVAMAASPQVTGYVRMLTPPSCGRCAILAGRVYRWSRGFARHPGCDCIMIPSVEDAAEDLTTDPQAYFDSLSAEDQDRYFTKAGAEAIRQGADMSQVVNARRGASGLSQPGRLTAAEASAVRGGRAARLQRVDVFGRQLAVTSEGTTKRGLAGQRLIAESGSTRTPGSRLRRAKTPRLMPEAVLQLAGDDRDLAQELLRKHGYVL